MNCDQIIVLDEGRIAERGTHEELIQLDGKYANLWNIQVFIFGKLKYKKGEGGWNTVVLGTICWSSNLHNRVPKFFFGMMKV